MATTYDSIIPEIHDLIKQQHMFFVATASHSGEVNLSPKGVTSLHILDPNRVAFVDYPGSGNQTATHLRENGRITIMLCTFEGAPAIVRLYGKGRVLTCEEAHQEGLAVVLGEDLTPLARQIFVIDVHQVQRSCGFGVPLYEYRGQRPRLSGHRSTL